ncbi:MAG TPA: response regulator, partial [Vicinamibacterales bacterium]|nr:response regulator [Vicinamibacterales bacterium]
LQLHGYRVAVYSSASAFLERPPADAPGCVLLDLRMPGLSGLDVQDALTRRGIRLPIVFLSGQSDVPSTARAMRDGAVDFLVKPIDELELVAAIERAVARSAVIRDQARLARDAAARWARLTKRERDVCGLVARGLLNKQIAWELGTSESTIKVHRGRVMRKLEVDSVADLVRLLAHVPSPAAGG